MWCLYCVCPLPPSTTNPCVVHMPQDSTGHVGLSCVWPPDPQCQPFLLGIESRRPPCPLCGTFAGTRGFLSVESGPLLSVGSLAQGSTLCRTMCGSEFTSPGCFKNVFYFLRGLTVTQTWWVCVLLCVCIAHNLGGSVLIPPLDFKMCQKTRWINT